VEKALRDGNHGNWPLITLNLDFKDNKPEHLAAVLALLRKYQPWLTTSVKGAEEADVQPLDVKPILVLTGEPMRSKPCSTISCKPGIGTALRRHSHRR
jgi:hypothetical protein